jgi:hypothetical protein
VATNVLGACVWAASYGYAAYTFGHQFRRLEASAELVRAPAATAQPKPTTDSAAAGLVSAPWSAAAVRSPPQAVSIAPSVPTTIEKSRPIVESQSPPEPAAGKETGVLSTLEQMLRQDPLAGTDQPPRPPMPVGQ